MFGLVVECAALSMARSDGDQMCIHMRRRRKLYFSFLAAMAVSLSGCGSACENEVVSEVTSPSGKFKAVMFERGCGATTGFNTQVSIIDADESVPDDAGNAIILDELVPLHIQWLSDDELSISGRRETQVFKQEEVVNGVRIRYENQPPKK